MRNSLRLLLFVFFTGAALSAQVKIGDNPQNINPSSVLELESTDKVLVITRVTTAQMNAIVPLQGALCYNIDLQSVHYFDGTQWLNIGSGGGTGGPLTADAIVNTQPTIVITPTATGDNLEVAPNSIRTEQIVDGGINGVDIQDGSIGPGKLQNNSVTEEKLSENSVGAFALDNDNIGVSAFNNDVGYITAADVNIVSGDANNVLETRVDGAFYNDQPLITAINQNTDAIALDDDQSITNEIQNLSIVGNQITLSDSNTITLPAGAVADGSETIVNAGTNVTVTGDGTVATPYVINSTGGGATADGSETKINPTATVTVAGTGTTLDPYLLTAVGGGTGGTTEVVDGTTLTGLGTGVDPFKIEPGATGQILTTSATGVVWANGATGSGSTEEADQTTITGIGTNADPFKIEPSPVIGQYLSTTAAGAVWADLPPSGGAALFDANTISGTGVTGDEYTVADDGITTVKILDANVTPIKIEPSVTVNQVLTTTAAGAVWADLPPSGGAALFDANTISGTGVTGDEYTVADDGITTVKILDANVTPIKIEPSATVNQVLTTTAAGAVWADLPPSGGAALFDTNTISGTGVTGDEYTVADDAITSIKIENNSILAEDLNDMGATDGQVLKWDDATTSWLTAADDTGAAALTEGNIFVGDASDSPQDVTMSGDATIDNTGALTIVDDAITTVKILDANVTPIKIEPSQINGQFLRTDTLGNVIWDDLPTGTGGAVTSDGVTITGTGADVASALSVPTDGISTAQIADDTILAEDLNDMGATDGQVLKWDDATTSWLTAADDTGVAALTDGNIFVGDATDIPQDVTMSGDATIDNAGALTIVDDAITLAKIDQNSATDGQILKWDDATTSWVTADDTGVTALTDGNIFVGDATDSPQDVTMTGDATIDNTGLITIEDDAVTSTKIANATILAEDLGDMGATDGEILQWNSALNMGAGGWEVATNAEHTGTANHIFFADAATGAPVTSAIGGLVWNPTAIAGAFPALAIGLDAVGTQSAKAKVHIMERYPLPNEISYGIQLQNRSTTNNTAVGMIFSVDDWITSYGKGALVFERTGDWAVGDFHFLQNNTMGTGTDVNPDLADKAFTITSNSDIGLYGGIDIGGAGSGFGTANQVLASDGPGNPVKWVNAGGTNLSTTNLTQTAGQDRTYNLNNQNLIFTGIGSVGIGNSANPPENKLHVAGEIRSEGYNSTFGTEAAPAYSFIESGNPDSDTGMYRPGADEIGFSVGGNEALKIEEPTTGITNVIVNQQIEFKGTVLDKDGDAGTTGQVLSSTGGANPQTNWINASSGSSPIKAKGKIVAGGLVNVTTGIGVTNGIGTDNVLLPPGLVSNTDYIIQLTVIGDFVISVSTVTPPTLSQFTVETRDRVSGALVEADYHFTIIE